ncbi:MAG: type I-C CRISPR-associated protein Cas7/Csd2 [Planctomycetota bacterium]
MPPRTDFVFLFDIKDGNPNGDPDAGNLPRVDPETGQGLVTDVCLKRKVRNFVGLAHGEEPPYEIYVKEKAVLNSQHARAYEAVGEKPEKRKLPKDAAKAAAVTDWMCHNFFDIRAFGAVMSTDVNCGQVRGPIQFTLSRSVDPILSQEHAVTRCAVTTEKEAEAQSGDNRTMGRKFTVPYGLYRGHGFVNPHLAAKTGFGEADLELFWKALAQMFEADRSAARGEMAPQALICFEHADALGNAPASKLFDRVTVSKKGGEDSPPPRSFTDYDVFADGKPIPVGERIDLGNGVTMLRRF